MIAAETGQLLTGITTTNEHPDVSEGDNGAIRTPSVVQEKMHVQAEPGHRPASQLSLPGSGTVSNPIDIEDGVNGCSQTTANSSVPVPTADPQLDNGLAYSQTPAQQDASAQIASNVSEGIDPATKEVTLELLQLILSSSADRLPFRVEDLPNDPEKLTEFFQNFISALQTTTSALVEEAAAEQSLGQPGSGIVPGVGLLPGFSPISQAGFFSSHLSSHNPLFPAFSGLPSLRSYPTYGNSNGSASTDTNNKAPLDPIAEAEAKRAEKEKVREENRERKKRWRESNADRNKDNDLRCRVTKRANKLYGTGNSEEKERWMKEEFEKRRAKREAKERARSQEASSQNHSAPISDENRAKKSARRSSRSSPTPEDSQHPDDPSGGLFAALDHLRSLTSKTGEPLTTKELLSLILNDQSLLAMFTALIQGFDFTHHTSYFAPSPSTSPEPEDHLESPEIQHTAAPSTEVLSTPTQLPSETTVGDGAPQNAVPELPAENISEANAEALLSQAASETSFISPTPAKRDSISEAVEAISLNQQNIIQPSEPDTSTPIDASHHDSSTNDLLSGSIDFSALEGIEMDDDMMALLESAIDSEDMLSTLAALMSQSGEETSLPTQEIVEEAKATNPDAPENFTTGLVNQQEGALGGEERQVQKEQRESVADPIEGDISSTVQQEIEIGAALTTVEQLQERTLQETQKIERSPNSTDELRHAVEAMPNGGQATEIQAAVATSVEVSGLEMKDATQDLGESSADSKTSHSKNVSIADAKSCTPATATTEAVEVPKGVTPVEAAVDGESTLMGVSESGNVASLPSSEAAPTVEDLNAGGPPSALHNASANDNFVAQATSTADARPMATEGNGDIKMVDAPVESTLTGNDNERPTVEQLTAIAPLESKSEDVTTQEHSSTSLIVEKGDCSGSTKMETQEALPEGTGSTEPSLESLLAELGELEGGIGEQVLASFAENLSEEELSTLLEGLDEETLQQMLQASESGSKPDTQAPTTAASVSESPVPQNAPMAATSQAPPPTQTTAPVSYPPATVATVPNIPTSNNYGPFPTFPGLHLPQFPGYPAFPPNLLVASADPHHQAAVQQQLKSLLDALEQNPNLLHQSGIPSTSIPHLKRTIEASAQVSPSKRPNLGPYPVARPINNVPQPPPYVPNRYPTLTNTARNMNASYAASFGNSAAMNQRLMMPAYRPPGLGYGVRPPVPAKPKRDESKVKAMGFPPMLAGMKKK